ncbi:phosphorylase b kinase gamma catalytic chain, skeletal muscle/heart isoform isoform X2 [Nematostella vectensis]|uniref:phosphorylase b kinase gamma catalytic chain, skeletal muscle/heart isoform isoform X2 n=1 Tax=Nematostella vectensis TaxID=45351 RepID=UPI0020773593|nr:phosphorylase b kinase gamma catalytic chain, skeletal muscle/heart isoform isoform X2 [Nematostella vectensis]
MCLSFTRKSAQRNSQKMDYLRIDGAVGSGVSSIVRKCYDKLTGKAFAVKIIDKLSDQGGSDIIATTRDEVNILLSLQGHKNIIRLEDVFESTAFFFLVFEIAPKGELFDYLTEKVTLSEKQTRRIMLSIFEAVDYMHYHNVVHRDLKPENILLDEEINVKISDFGFAVELKEGETLRELCGTPGYLAPEVLQCSMFPDAPGYTKEVDMWACGVILYTLLCGFPPFWHRRQVVMLRNIMNGKYNFSSPEWEDVSNDAKNLIKKLLVVHPKERITASDALKHPWLQSTKSQKNDRFCARWKFKGAVLAVIAVQEFRRFIISKILPVSFDIVTEHPYGNKPIRKLIDGCAFRIYGHWVKRNKDENQNRAALFENNTQKYLNENDGPTGNVRKHVVPYEVSFRVSSFRSGRRPPSTKSS